MTSQHQVYVVDYYVTKTISICQGMKSYGRVSVLLIYYSKCKMHLNLKYSSSRKQVELDVMSQYLYFCLNPSNAELNPIFQLLALLSHPILHVGGIRVNYPACMLTASF